MSSYAQERPISLQWDQFYDEHGEPFFPMIMNYYVQYAYPTTGSITIPDPSPAEMATCRLVQNNFQGTSILYNYSDINQSTARILQDLYETKLLGFNTVRVVNTPKKKPGTGFLLPIRCFDCTDEVEEFANMDPPYDPATDHMVAFHFDNILQFCSLANSLDLKVLLITADPMKTGYPELMRGNAGSTEITDYTDYLAALATFLQTNQVNNILGYDLYGEPSLAEDWIKSNYGASAMHKKDETCAIVDQWVTAIHAADPGRLITVGFYPMRDPFAGGWDPLLSKIDFATVHIYPVLSKSEFAVDPVVARQRCIDRYLNEMYFVDKTVRKPYIVAETGYSAHDGPEFRFPIASYGDESNQNDFVQQTFSVIRDSRACGYAWWDFQDHHWYSRSEGQVPDGYYDLDEYKEDFFALINWGNPGPMDMANGISGYEPFRKQAAWTFASYAQNAPPSSTSNFGPASPTLDMNDQFYNASNHPPNTVVWPENGSDFYGTVTGHVQDEDGNPMQHVAVKGTSIVALTEATMTDPATEHYNGYSTFTDQNGNFEIRGFDSDNSDSSIPNYPLNYSPRDFAIIDLKIGSYATAHQQFGFWDGVPYDIPQNGTYELITLANKFDVILDGILIGPPDQESYEALVSLTANNVVVSGGGAALKATHEVDLHNGFHAASGSEVHVYTDFVSIACSDITDAGFMITPTPNNSTTSGTTKSRNEQFIDLSLHSKKGTPVRRVFPNPSTGLVLIDLFDSENLGTSNIVLAVRDQLGHEIHRQRITSGRTELDLSGKAKGVYQLNVSGIEFNFNRSFVLQ